MSLTIWMLAIGLVLIIEGIGPLFFPKHYQQYLAEILQMKPTTFQRIGGSLVTAGIVILFFFS